MEAQVAAAVDVTLLSRFTKRFADHAVEVARRVIFQATGAFPRRANIHRSDASLAIRASFNPEM